MPGGDLLKRSGGDMLRGRRRSQPPGPPGGGGPLNRLSSRRGGLRRLSLPRMICQHTEEGRRRERPRHSAAITMAGLGGEGGGEREGAIARQRWCKWEEGERRSGPREVVGLRGVPSLHRGVPCGANTHLEPT